MTDINLAIDFIFTQFTNLWNTIVLSWVLSVPILLLLLANIYLLIKGIYKQ